MKKIRRAALNKEEKEKYHVKYKAAKQIGAKFYPDIIYKDLLVVFGIFLLLIGLAVFVGVANEPPADPSDSSYIPRPEWYFLFLFQLLKFFPGKLEWVGTTVLPTLAVGALILLPFYDHSPFRYWKKRKIAIGVMSIIVVGILSLSIMAVITTPPQPETGATAATLTEQISAGQDLYSIHCVECHGADGEGGEIKGVEGLEGYQMKAINSQDVMYTRTDETLFNVIDFGQPALGMPPFGKGYGGELLRGNINLIVTFMRYTWDDRSEIPVESQTAAAMPVLGPNDVPSYEVNIQPIIKRYCISCHRSGKANNNFSVASYEDILKSGDHAPNVVAGDLNSNFIQMINRKEITAGGPMPPTKSLPPEMINIFERWVKAGMPETTADAARLSSTTSSATPEVSVTPTP
jgi:menaquinol-cytochrome c reductase cytochrome b/c subunit